MNIQRVPAYLDLPEKRIEVGTALVDNDMNCVTITLKDELPAEARSFFAQQDSAYSISPEIDPSQLCSDHKPVQHRDSAPPWCNKCGLTAKYEFPRRRLSKS